MSRIDICLGLRDLLPHVTEIEFLTRMCSDHAPLLISLRRSNSNPLGHWRLPAKWIVNPKVEERVFPQLTQYWDVNQGTAKAHVVWDAGKAFIRGMYISLIKAARQEYGQTLSLAQDALAKAEADLSLVQSDETELGMQTAQRDIDLLLTEKYSQRELHRTAAWYDKGDKNGKLLALLAKGDVPRTVIRSVRDGTNELTDPEQMTEHFRQYFKRTYQVPLDNSVQGLTEYLNDIEFPEVPLDLVRQLDKDITVDEVKEAIKAFPSGKTPGPDGIPIEWYKKYADFLSPKMVELFNGNNQPNTLPDSCYDAYVTLILKPDKPPEQCESYRPISLLNSDIKIFAKILANRLKLVIPELIHPDQTGFMPSKATDINLRRLFTNLSILHENPGNRIVVALDTAKAFDTVQWHYLWEVLTRYGFGPRYRNWIQMLYARPRAKILVNGRLTEAISLERGTRQGCPLSPMLFALAIEPLAIRIRAHEAIEGLRIGNITEKISLYADDMLLYLANSHQALMNLLAVLSEFGRYSGLRINHSKSIIFPIDPLPPGTPEYISQLQVVSSFKYLGITVHKDLNKYEQLNLNPVVQALTNKVAIWQDLPLSLPGRVNILKMIFLPKFLYPLHNAPITPRAKWFSGVDRIIREFLWAGDHPRLNIKILQAPSSGGGLALPNFNFYFLAAQLVYAHWWMVPNINNPAVVLEAATLGSYEALAKLPYRGTSPLYATTPPMATVVRAFQKSQKLAHGSLETWSPQTPLWGNKQLSHLHALPDIARWAQLGIKTLEDIVAGGECKTYDTLRQEMHPPPRICSLDSCSYAMPLTPNSLLGP
uniref:Reverse transcriptase domain-containing protein n=1 Tax=Xenopus tropicalis TaxID=8364 RepID=A0A6I8T0L1_XENTR